MKRILMGLFLMPLFVFGRSDLYMVIDLSGGTTAAAYPISYLSDVPEGGWTDEHKTTKLVLRRIEAGTCVVTVDKPYYAGVFEVTQKQYALITGARPSEFAGYDKRPVELVSFDMIRGSNKGSKYPDSTDVDDSSFMGRLRARTGIQFDLPTEAQFEYACRAGATTKYCYGDSADGEYMWYVSNSEAHTHEVGTRKQNQWGLYDMHGNVWEWCADRHTEYSTTIRMFRAGSFYDPPGLLAANYQHGNVASFVAGTLGFRVFCPVSAAIPETPVLKPVDGTTFDTSLTVSMTCASEGATIHYTTDGTTPTMESTAYSSKFKIYEKTTVKAIAFYDDGRQSEMAVAVYAKGFCATPVITAQAEFTGSKQRVDIACATEGATIRYTTDGKDPNSHSTKYKGPFYVTDTTTVKAYATKTEYVNSEISSFLITKVWGTGDTMGKPDHAFETSGAKGFVSVVDSTATLGKSMKSGAITDDQKSILSTKVIGPGTLTFKWKASCEEDDEYEWDHGEFKVNGVTKGYINGITGWIEVSQRIDGKGTNTVTWTYIKDDVEAVEQDCIWVSDYAWVSDYTTTQTTEVPVPYDWLLEKSRDAVDEYDSYEKVAKQTAYNPRFTVEQCYVAGLDPESTTNEFTSAITMEGGVPKITWKPNLGEGREYKIWGKAALDGAGDWSSPTNSAHRFFKVTVEMR